MKAYKTIQLLNNNHIKYKIIRHPTAFTSQEIAHASHISGKMIAKPVIVKIDGKMKMMVLPGNKKVHMRILRNLFRTEDVELASEDEFNTIFSDCEIGGMPPFGNVYNMDVYISKELINDDEIAFNAGNHSELICISYSDYATLVHPNVMEFSG